jgi:uncharacterized membrane protein YoaK (UPF0700 family)
MNKKILFTYVICIALIFNAGWIDSVVLYKSFGASVAAMTGNYRILGHSITEFDFDFAYQVIILIVGFIIGAAINGLVIKEDHYIIGINHTKTLILQSLILLIGTMLIDNHLNEFLLDDIFLAIAMGMQNSFTTLFFGAFARTTHMTGTTTDLGIEIGRALRGDFRSLWKIPFFITCLIAFTLGNAAGVLWIGISGQYFTFMLFPSVLLPIIVGIIILYVYQLKKKNN